MSRFLSYIHNVQNALYRTCKTYFTERAKRTLYIHRLTHRLIQRIHLSKREAASFLKNKKFVFALQRSEALND